MNLLWNYYKNVVNVTLLLFLLNPNFSSLSQIDLVLFRRPPTRLRSTTMAHALYCGAFVHAYSQCWWHFFNIPLINTKSANKWLPFILWTHIICFAVLSWQCCWPWPTLYQGFQIRIVHWTVKRRCSKFLRSNRDQTVMTS